MFEAADAMAFPQYSIEGRARHCCIAHSRQCGALNCIAETHFDAEFHDTKSSCRFCNEIQNVAEICCCIGCAANTVARYRKQGRRTKTGVTPCHAAVANFFDVYLPLLLSCRRGFDRIEPMMQYGLWQVIEHCLDCDIDKIGRAFHIGLCGELQ